MRARLNWLRLPVSQEVTVAVGADEVDVVEVVLVVEVDECVVDVLVDVDVVECLVDVGLVDVEVVLGGGLDVVVGLALVVVVVVSGAGSPPPKSQLPYATPWSKPPGTRYVKRPGERSIAV